MGPGFLLGMMKCSGIRHGESCTTVNRLKFTELYTVKGWSFMVCEFYINLLFKMKRRKNLKVKGERV